ncbi:MAG: RluA family pseudouridine synthase [Subdoligranulum sp.]|nr:RluA family pseudouridine synthase [Subdoligranulum sp.]
MKMLTYTAGAQDAGQRIDTALAAAFPELTRSYVQQLAANGQVLCNGRPAAKSARLAAGDALCVSVPDAQPVQVMPQDIPLDILYEDDALLVVNKPKGMVVHPAAGNPAGTLVNALLHHCAGRLSGINGELRPGIVHRIDKDTSGLLVVAKDNAAHAALSQQFAVHSITRVYHTVVYGGFSADDGVVEGQIGRHPVDRKRMAVLKSGGKYAYTGYHVEERFPGFTYLSVQLKTGRTHQIRVHLASIGHPVAGDAVYGPKKVITQLDGQCLHAKTLGFQHPVTGGYMEFDSPLPDYFTAFLGRLEKER